MAVSQDIYTAIKKQKDDPNFDPNAPQNATPPPVNQDTSPVIVPPNEPQVPPFDENKWLTDRFQGKYKSFDELQAELNKQPQVQVQVEKPVFPNDTSRIIYESLTTPGKELDVLPYLETRKIATAIQGKSPEERVKLFLQTEYDLTPQQAEREYERQYVPDETGLSDIDIAIERQKSKTKLERDAANAVSYFTKRAEEIKLTPIAPEPAYQPTDQEKQVMEIGQKYTIDKISKFPFEFNAEDKGIAVKGEVTLPGDRITELKRQIEAAPNAFLAGFLARYYTPDNKVNADALARDAVYLDEPASWAGKVAEQTINQTFLKRLEQERNRATGGNFTGGPFNAPEEETQKNTVYKALRIPIDKKPAVVAPQG